MTRVSLTLDETRSDRLRTTANRPGLRAFTPALAQLNLFTTVLAALLHRLSGQDHLRLGAPVHNRSTPAWRATIGLFMEIGVLDLAIDPGESFLSLAAKVARETQLNLRHSGPGSSSAAANNAYSALVNFVNADMPPFADLETTVHWHHTGYGDAQHALRLQVHDFGQTGCFTLHFDLNESQFAPADCPRLVSHFLQLLDACLADPETALGAVSLLTAAERQALVVDFNAGSAPLPPQSVIDLLEAQAAATPDAVAVSGAGRDLTYAALDRRANQLARLSAGAGRRTETA